MTSCAYCGEPSFGHKYCGSECAVLGQLDHAADLRRRALNAKYLRQARYIDEALTRKARNTTRSA